MSSATRWVSFTDDDHTTWLFDVDFMLSDWRCSFGNGCQGTEPDDNGARGCCAHGAYLVDSQERERIANAASLLTPQQWENRELVTSDDDIFTTVDGDQMTTTVDGGCVFLNSPEFAGGHGCALHIGALAHGHEPMTWKPNVCWQVPFRLEHYEDGAGTMTYALRRWRRSDWGEGGAGFSWWCTDELSPAADPSAQTWRQHRAEITELVGEWAFEALAGYLEDAGCLEDAGRSATPVELRSERLQS